MRRRLWLVRINTIRKLGSRFRLNTAHEDPTQIGALNRHVDFCIGVCVRVLANCINKGSSLYLRNVLENKAF